MKNVIVSLVVGWFVFWVCLWGERGGPYSRLSVDDLPGPVIVATLAGLASWAGITAWPWARTRLAKRRALRESRTATGLP